MRYLKILTLLIIVSNLFAQDTTYNNILKEVKSKNFKKVVELCKERLSKKSDEHLSYAYLSFAYFSLAERKKIDIDKEALRQRGIKKGQTYLFKEGEKIQDFLVVKNEYNRDTLLLAKDNIQKAIKIQPKNFEYRLSLGQVYLALGEHSNLLKSVDSIITEFPIIATAKALSKFGLNYFNERNFDRALAVYRTIMQKFPAYTPAYSDAGTIYILRGELDSAVNFLQHAYDLEPADSLNLNSLAQLNLYLQDFSKSVFYKEKLYEKNPNSLPIILDLAFLYSYNDRKKSVKMFNNFLDAIKNSKDFKTWKDIAEAVNSTKKRTSDDPQSLLVTSEKLSGMGYSNYAIILLARIIAVDKGNNPAYFDLALFYRDLNMYDKALEYFTKCENLTGELASSREIVSLIYAEKAKTYLLKNDYNNIYKYAKLCLEKYKKNTGEIHYLLGIVYESQGKFDIAEKEFNQAIKLNDNPKITEQAKVELQDINIKRGK